MTIVSDLSTAEEPWEAPEATEATEAPEAHGRGAVRRYARQIWQDLKGWKYLRFTPYGVAPAAVIAAVFFFQAFDSEAFNVAGPEFLKRGINVQAIVSIVALIGVVGVLANLAIGWFADRHGRVWIFSLGTVLSGLAAMASALRVTAGAVGGARVVDEVGSDADEVPQYSLLADYYPPETRGRAFSFVSTLVGLAGVVATFVAAVVIDRFGLRVGFLMIGAPIALSGVVAVLVLRDPIRGYFDRRSAGADDDAARREEEPQSFGEAWRSVWAIRTIRRFTVADVFLNMADAPFALFSQLYLAERYGLSIIGRGLFSVPLALGSLIGGAYGGTLVDRLGKRNPQRVIVVYGVVQVLVVVSMIGYAIKPPIVVLAAWLTLRHLPDGLGYTGRKTVITQVIPANVRTQGIQVQGLASLPAFLFGFPLAGIILRLYGYRVLFLSFIPYYAVGGLLLISAASFFERDRRAATAAGLAAEEWRRAQVRGQAKLLVCRDVDVEYDGVQVLFGVDFDVDEGEIIALLGTNGAGKSTLLRAISGSQQASNGGVIFDGRDITHMPPHEIAARGVVHMPGGRGIFPDLSVGDNLVMATWLANDPDQAKLDLCEIFEMFGVLRERLGDRAGLLSGGQQQMLSLAQAFLMKPKLLMIDELSLGLSPAMVSQLLDAVREIHRRGVTIIVVEQSVNVALSLAERAIFMEKGEVKFQGRTADLLSRPDILRAVYVKGTGALTDSVPASAARTQRQRRSLELGTSPPVLDVDAVVKRFGGVTALDGVGLDLREGEVLGLIGPNGSGKTTLLDIISGFVLPDEGVVRYEGLDITRLSPEARAERKLVRRFQDARLFGSLTVFETLLVALDRRSEVRSTVLAALGAPQSRRSERRVRVRAERLIELFELGALRDKFVKELSTGLRRIVDLACVLASEPRVLLLDEPSSGIAQAEAEGLGPLLRRVKFETGCSMVIVEHDMPLISAVSDELVALDQGALVIRGTPEQVLNDDRVIESYLGASEAAIRRSGGLR